MFYFIFAVIIILGVKDGLSRIKNARKSIPHTSERNIDMDSLIWYEIGRETKHD